MSDTVPPVTKAQAQPVPNHRGRILLLGLASWLIGIVGLMALGQGLDHLQRIKRGEMDSEGKGMIVFGMVLGVMGFVVNLSLIIHQCASK